MHYVLCLVLLTLGLEAFAQEPAAPASAREAEPSRFPSFLEPCDELEGMLCGTYEVWENRESRSGRRIGLNLVVLPATGPGPVGAPIFPLAGGPGQGATEGIGFAVSSFGPLRNSRDIVLLDQRGTGDSNPLDCGELPEGASLQDVLRDFRTREFAEKCRESLDADVRLYTTEDAVGDLEEIRAALGYEQIDLVGGSYGTRVALHYMRRFPERVRAVVLDGLAPPVSPYVASFARAFENTLHFVFERCQEDPACRESVPDPEDDWAKALARFPRGDLETKALNPETGKVEAVTLSRGEFVDGIRRLLYGSGQWPRAMRTIQAAAAGDFGPFIESEFASRRGIMRQLSLGMLLSVSCAENLPFLDENAVKEATQGTSLGDHRVRTLRDACLGWDYRDLPADWSSPVSSEAPVLILSGEIDPATPPWVAAEAAGHLSNSLHLIIPNRSHSPNDLECEDRVIQDFLRTGSPEGLDTSCLDETPWPPFESAVSLKEGVSVDVAILETYVGKYQVQPGFVVEVVLEENQLFVVPPGEPKELLKPQSKDTFFVTGFGQQLTFLKNAAGIVDRFSLQNGPTATRID